MNNLKTAGGYMNEVFKINMYFDEKSEEIEKLISHLLISKLEKMNEKFLSLQHLNSKENSYKQY